MPEVTDIRLRFLEDDEAEWVYSHHPEIGRSPDTYCPTCDKKGTYRWQGEDHDCDCEHQLQLLKHYLASGIGVPYQRLSWNDLNNETLTRQVEEYVLNAEYARRGIGLFLLGQPGVGKTMVGTLCLKTFIRNGYTGFATSFAEMLDMYASGWKDKADRKRFQRKVIESQVLLLDDIGKEADRLTSNLPESTFDLVLRERVRHGRSTIITTNMDPKDVESGYGHAILSLLREKSISISVGGEDFRKQAHDREMAEIAAGETRPIN